jgi:hypothetical protein
MFNPLCLLTPPLLDAFVKANKKYFVRQSYPRGESLIDKDIKGYFLISHYADLTDAKQHFVAISKDAHRYLYNWENQEDRQKLNRAVTQPEGYKIFAAVVMPDWKKRAETVLDKKIRHYIDHKLKWHPGRYDTVDFELFPQFGEVFVTLKLRNQRIKVSLEEVEVFKV